MQPASRTAHADTSLPARIDFVDYAKGLCIVMVVMMHTTLGLGETLGREGFMHTAVAFARPFRMPDFFLISGLFLSRVIDRPWRGYLDAKALHFAYFYALWVLVQFAFKAPAALATGDEATLREFMLAPIEPFGTLWFIYLLPIFFVLGKALRGFHPLVVWLAAALLETAGFHTGWTVIDELAGRWVYFVTGAVAAPAVFALARAVVAHRLVALAALVTWAALNAAAVFTPAPAIGEASLAQAPGLRLALGLVGAGAVVTVSALLANSGRWPWLRVLGERSIVIYLAFFLPMAVGRAVAVRLFPDGDAGWLALGVSAFAIAVPVLLDLVTRGTRLGFLFTRPAWARLDREPRPRVRAQRDPTAA